MDGVDLYISAALAWATKGRWKACFASLAANASMDANSMLCAHHRVIPCAHTRTSSIADNRFLLCIIACVSAGSVGFSCAVLVLRCCGRIAISDP